MGEDAIRSAFREQARWCERLGSPFTARLCETLARLIDRADPVGARLLEWRGDAVVDALPLRLCGGLNALVRSGRAKALAALWPPAPLPEPATLAAPLAATLSTESKALVAWLDRPPQTNEVGRAAVLMSGLLVIAERFGLAIDLLELGSSAGLNLQLDRYDYRLGGLAAGDPDSPLRLAPIWHGPPPPDAPIRICARRGVDIAPIDPLREGERLSAYVWPDQAERVDALDKALLIARSDPPPVDAGEAADWLGHQLSTEPRLGVCRTILHSVAFQYFAADSQARIAARLEVAGARASARAPLAWLRFEMERDDQRHSLRLRTWPGGESLLAWVHPHGRVVEWQVR